jgi:molecular chaperone GrpE
VMGDVNDSRARLDEDRPDEEPELIVEEHASSRASVEGTPEEPADDWERIAAERLDDLLRTKAEFENFRKRTMRDQADFNARATRSLVERLLPVLDNFDRAIAHGDSSPGLALVHRELVGVLSGEGLEIIAAEGKPFDPHFHEAVESHEDTDVDEPTVRSVHRAGYVFKDKVLRPAMVSVARPLEAAAEPNDNDPGGE